MKHLSAWIPCLAGALLATALAAPSMAQPPCDSLHLVTFTYATPGGYQYDFEVLNPDATVSPTYTEWAFLGEGFMQGAAGDSVTVTFPGAATYLACIRTFLTGGNLPGWCESVHCGLVEVPVDPACADLVAGFTISLQGDSIQFHDLSEAPAGSPIISRHWDFGDGTYSDAASPLHRYAGNGPYEACLTVSTGTCTATACNWIYTGPPSVPCEVLLQPSIDVLQYRHVIAAFDHSVTSGMSSSLSWDFGDGTTGTGNPVLHAYEWEGFYQVCGETRLWGPLTPDTCVASDCRMVDLGGAVGVPITGSGSALRAWPLPFTEQLSVAGTGPGASWQLLDLTGRVHLAGTAPATGTFILAGGGLPAGIYLLRITGPQAVRTLRVVKAEGAG